MRTSMTWTAQPDGSEKLMVTKTRHAATVWPNGTWHTWDDDGVGGENGCALTVTQAKQEAEESVVWQGFHQ